MRSPQEIQARIDQHNAELEIFHQVKAPKEAIDTLTGIVEALDWTLQTA